MTVEELIQELQKQPQGMYVEMTYNDWNFSIDQIFISDRPPHKLVLYGTRTR